MFLLKSRAVGALAGAALVSSALLIVPHAVGAETADSGSVGVFVDCSAAVNGDGTQDHPLNSLTAVNQTQLQAGTKLLFKTDTTCNSTEQNIDGTTTLAGLRIINAKGTTDKPITITSYGNGATPIIAGNGVSETLLLKNSENITVTGLEITNTDPNPANQKKYIRRGIVIMNDNAGALHNINITNNYVHDVYGQAKKNLGGSGGIQAEIYGVSVPVVGANKTQADVITQDDRPGLQKSWFDGVAIVNNRVENVTRSGINMATDWSCREDMGLGCTSFENTWTPSLNYYVAGNQLNHIGGDGIVVKMTDGAVVEKNRVFSSSEQPDAESNAAVWVWNADNTLFQYNEVAYTQRATTNYDGLAWDFDYGSRNTVYQYNYSHDNAGGALLTCACSFSTAISVGATFRYNLSVNDGVNPQAMDFSQNLDRTISFANVTDMSVYNNTFVLPDKENFHFSTHDNYGSATFTNNLIISSGTITDENTRLVTAGRHLTYADNVFVGSDSASGSWPQLSESTGNTYVPLADYLAASGVDLEALKAGDLSSLNAVNQYTQGAGRPMASAGMPYALTNSFLDGEQNTAKSFPESFASQQQIYGQQNAVPVWSNPDIGAYQSPDADLSAPTVQTLAAGATTQVQVPGNATIKVTATQNNGGRLGVSIANGRDFVQNADAGDGRVSTYVRTSSDASALRVENTSTGTVDNVVFERVWDNMRDGSFESATSADKQKKSASPWTLASADNSQNRDDESIRIYKNPRSSLNQAGVVVSGEYAAVLGSEAEPYHAVRLNQRTIPATPGAVYHLGFWAVLGQSADGSPATLNVQVKSAPTDSSTISTFAQYTTEVFNESLDASGQEAAAGGKIYYSKTFTVPADADPYSALWVSIAQPDLADGAYAYIDNVTLVPETATPDPGAVAPTPQPSESATPIPTASASASAQPSESATPAPSASSEPTPQPSESAEPTVQPSESAAPTPTATVSPTAGSTASSAPAADGSAASSAPAASSTAAASAPGAEQTQASTSLQTAKGLAVTGFAGLHVSLGGAAALVIGGAAVVWARRRQRS